VNSPHPTQTERPTAGRLFLGGAIFVVGQLMPLGVPVVTSSDLAGTWKTILSTLLFIAPELFLLLAVAILGKQGFNYLTGIIKKTLGRFFAKHGPPEVVSPRRYRIGLVMFVVPLLLAWATPYFQHHLPGFEARPILYAVSGDLLLIASVFVLGGEFWDKLRALFIHGARAQFPDSESTAAS
jgi:hypothetical protein